MSCYTRNYRAIYDPSGGFGISQGSEVVSGDMRKEFSEYHAAEGDTVEMTCKNTTKEQEKRIQREQDLRPTAAGPTCSTNVSSVLVLSGAFKGVQPRFFPGDLADDFKKAEVKHE